jgi:hypothetical protein
VNRRRLLRLSFLRAALTALLWSAYALAHAQTAATVIEIAGMVVETDAAGRSRVLAMDSSVASGSVLRTATDSHVRLKFGDGTALLLRPNTEFSVGGFRFEQARPDTDSFAIRLIKGGFRQVTGLIGKRSPHAIDIRAASATIGIRGTDFAVRMCEDDCGANDKADQGRAQDAQRRQQDQDAKRQQDEARRQQEGQGGQQAQDAKQQQDAQRRQQEQDAKRQQDEARRQQEGQGGQQAQDAKQQQDARRRQQEQDAKRQQDEARRQQEGQGGQQAQDAKQQQDAQRRQQEQDAKRQQDEARRQQEGQRNGVASAGVYVQVHDGAVSLAQAGAEVVLAKGEAGFADTRNNPPQRLDSPPPVLRHDPLLGRAAGMPGCR